VTAPVTEGLKEELFFEDTLMAQKTIDEIKGTGASTIRPRIEHEQLMEIIESKISKTMFGRRLEEPASIQPVFLTLLSTRIKLKSGRLLPKEYENDILWDTVTGELVVDYKNGLKRTSGLDMFYTLTQPQMKVLHKLSSYRGREVDDLIKTTELTKSKTKSALTKLMNMGLIESKPDKTGKVEHYKRIHKLKLPNHPEKLKFEMPEMVHRDNREQVLEPHYLQKQIGKVLVNIIPGSKLIKSKEIYYPYFKVELLGKGNKHRIILIDAVSGSEDKLLADCV
jgi:DNA-binding MarR family transcriptional regulator